MFERSNNILQSSQRVLKRAAVEITAKGVNCRRYTWQKTIKCKIFIKEDYKRSLACKQNSYNCIFSNLAREFFPSEIPKKIGKMKIIWSLAWNN